MVHYAMILIAGLAAGAMASPAMAQVPVSGAPDCVCLRIAVDALGADLAAKRQAYDSIQNEIGRIDSQLEGERSRMDVNSPEAIARFRQALERRDALFRQSSGPVFGELGAATDRYGARVQEYNGRCAGRPLEPALLAQAQATHACPPPY
jgi:multidrug resistance efflux pump